jgi:hypothetical protein
MSGSVNLSSLLSLIDVDYRDQREIPHTGTQRSTTAAYISYKATVGENNRILCVSVKIYENTGIPSYARFFYHLEETGLPRA